jgi:charged multivesicular body protein 3
MSEMVDDTLDGLDENEDELDEEAQEEVDKVLFQITDGKLGQANGAVGALPVSYTLPIKHSTSRRLTQLGCAQQKNGPTAEDLEKDEEMERAIAGLLSS